MIDRLKNIWLGLVLIALACGVLLYSDIGHRSENRPSAALSKTNDRADAMRGPTYEVGLLYFGPHPVFDQAIAGTLEALSEAGFVEGENLVLHRAHPNNDMTLLPQVARAVGDKKLDVLLVFSTPALGAALSQTRDIPIVFGVVSSPLQAGAGADFTNHHPRVTGAVWMAPSPDVFPWLKRLFPDVRNVGLVYNPAEANSLDEKERARVMMAAAGMTMKERTIAVSSDVVPALQSLLAEGIDAIFGMADNTAMSAFEALVRASRRAGIPLIADDSSQMGTGALLAIGASPRGEGRHAGRLALRVLRGEDPAGIPFAPTEHFETSVDFAAAAQLGMTLPDELLRQTTIFFNPAARLGRPLRVALVSLVQNPLLDAADAGVVRGLREAGFVEGEGVTIKRFNAQGEMAQLPALLDAAAMTHPDVIMTLTTPALMAAVHHIKTFPLVFAVASDPAELHLFDATTRPDHVTGVHDDPPVDRLLAMAREQNPFLPAVGIVYDAAQPNSLISVRRLRAAGQEQNVKIIEATASTLSDLPAATQLLIQRGARAIILSADNLVATGFPTIHKIAHAQAIPIYVDATHLVDLGASGSIGNDYEAWGAQAGLMAARVLAGVPPRALPVETAQTRKVIRPREPRSGAPRRPWGIRVVRYNDAQFSVDSFNGIRDGLVAEGLVEERDFTLTVHNAQGDMTTLSSIMATVRARPPDMLMVISTPALQAALRQAGPVPIVFCSVGDGVQAGAGESVSNHLPNVTGITTRSPFEPMARLIRAMMPEARAVGTLFTPGEINSELYREWFAEALHEEGIALVAIPVNTSGEVAEATTALLKSNIALIAQIADNTTRPAYPQMARRATLAGLPFFCFDSAGMKDGAALAYARDYHANGMEAAGVALRVLRGESPANIPFTNTRSEVLMFNPAVLSTFNLELPEAFRAVATPYAP